MPRKLIDSVTEVERTGEAKEIVDYTEFVSRHIAEVMGVDRELVVLANPTKVHKIAQLKADGFRLLRWDEVTDKERKGLDSVLPFRGPDQVTKYGDLCILIATREALSRRGAWKRDQAALGLEAQERQIRTRVEFESDDVLENVTPEDALKATAGRLMR